MHLFKTGAKRPACDCPDCMRNGNARHLTVRICSLTMWHWLMWEIYWMSGYGWSE
ncbi:hypothetical protein BDZ97DRAFT_1786018 [Flammula alnicola]|nr:hypothetical protein BDZ97DRAFT_1786018 [Flammula alnicola]